MEIFVYVRWQRKLLVLANNPEDADRKFNAYLKDKDLGTRDQWVMTRVLGRVGNGVYSES